MGVESTWWTVERDEDVFLILMENLEELLIPGTGGTNE